jgi:hypothetical protein
MIRLVADDGNVYLKYDLEEVCYDTIGAPQEVYHSNVGTYPIPITQPTLDYGADGTAREVVNGPIVRIDTGYSIPFTKENADKIHEVANDTSFTNRTQYLIKSNGRKYTVEKYEDFRDRTIEELQTGSYLKGESKSLKTK